MAEIGLRNGKMMTGTQALGTTDTSATATFEGTILGAASGGGGADSVLLSYSGSTLTFTKPTTTVATTVTYIVVLDA